MFSKEVISKLAHDLKGPIGNMSMFNELLIDELKSLNDENSVDLDQSIWYAEYIKSISDKYVDQLQNWTDLFLMHHNSIQSQFSKIIFLELVNEIVKLNKESFEKKGTSLELNSQIDSETLVFVDSDMLRRVIDNLFVITAMLIDSTKMAIIEIHSKENVVEFKIVALQAIDKEIFQNLYTPNPNIEAKEQFKMGMVKPTGFSLAFSAKAIQLFDGEIILETKNDDLIIGFTLPTA